MTCAESRPLELNVSKERGAFQIIRSRLCSPFLSLAFSPVLQNAGGFFYCEGGQWNFLGPSWLALTWFCALGKSTPFPSPGFLGCLAGVTVFSVQAQVIVQLKISAQGKQAYDRPC